MFSKEKLRAAKGLVVMMELVLMMSFPFDVSYFTHHMFVLAGYYLRPYLACICELTETFQGKNIIVLLTLNNKYLKMI